MCFVGWRKLNEWLEKEHDEFLEGFTKFMFQQVLHHDVRVAFWSYLYRINSDWHGIGGKWKITSMTTTLMKTPKANSIFSPLSRCLSCAYRSCKNLFFAHTRMMVWDASPNVYVLGVNMKLEKRSIGGE